MGVRVRPGPTNTEDRKMKYTIKEIVKDRKATFVYYRQAHLYFKVVMSVDEAYLFPIPIHDLMEASVMAEERAITLMRYIRKALEDGTFVRYY